MRVQRFQIRRLAPRQLALQPHQWTERAMHAEGHQCQQQGRQHADGDQGAVDHFLRQFGACTAGLPHLHLHFTLRRSGGKAALDHHEAHRLTAVVCIEQLRLVATPARCLGKILVAGDGAATTIGHAVEHAVFFRHRQQVQGRIWQIHLPLPIHQCHRIGDGQRRRHQQMVVGAIRRTLPVVARGEQQGYREHRQQRAQIQHQGAPQ